MFQKRRGKQSSDDKEITTASETPALTKITCKFLEAWKDKYNWLRFDGKENKNKCSVSFIENSLIGKTVSFINLQTKMAYI